MDLSPLFMIKIAAGMLVSGMLFSAGPCLASCGPFLVSYIAGTQKDIPRAVVFYSLFSLSKTAVYLALGLGFYFLGNLAREYLISGYVALLGGIFIAACGLFVIFGKRLSFSFFSRWEKFFSGGQLRNPLVFGLIYGAMPCLPLVSLLSYSGLVSQSWYEVLIYIFCFGLGTYFSPLLLLSIFSGALTGLMRNSREKYSLILRILSGSIIVFFGLQMALKGG